MPRTRVRGDASETALFEWALNGTGWPAATVRLGDAQPVVMVASYLHDSLHDLASSVGKSCFAHVFRYPAAPARPITGTSILRSYGTHEPSMATAPSAPSLV